MWGAASLGSGPVTMLAGFSGGIMDLDIRNRISFLRYLLICGIVILHVPPYEALPDAGDSLFGLIKAFFSHAVFRTSVPVLTAISGYLLFRSGLDRNWGKLVRKKSKSLLWPLFLFNAVLLPVFYFLQWSGASGVELSTTVYPFNGWAWLDALLGLTGPPLNYPLNFLRDLFVLALLAPAFGWFLRNAPWIGLGLLLVIVLNNLDGSLVLRNTMAINFYVGGLAAVAQWDLRKLDRQAPVLAAIFLAICVAVVAFEIEDRKWLAMTAPFIIWPISAVFHDTMIGRWMVRASDTSFFIFLTHSLGLFALWFAYKQFLVALPYPLFWCLAPLVVIGGCRLAYHGLTRWFHPALRLALGGRSG